MQFLRRNRFALLTVAVLILAAVLALRQQLANRAAHAQYLEDFILLHERGAKKPCDHLYQVLVQRLPQNDNHTLVQDLVRTAMLVDTGTSQLDNLVWKYHVSVRNELKRRSEKRLEAALKAAGTE